jgi:hypothetical protein
LNKKYLTTRPKSNAECACWLLHHGDKAAAHGVKQEIAARSAYQAPKLLTFELKAEKERKDLSQRTNFLTAGCCVAEYKILLFL